MLPVSFCLFRQYMTYDSQILGILSEVGGRGISVGALAKHVCNMNRTLFDAPDLESIYRYVRQYLQRNSKSAQSLVESTGRRGHYRLNPRNTAVRELMLEFREGEEETEEEEKPQKDFSLELFG